MADPDADYALDLVRMTRAALAAAGFERHEHDGMVWFAGGSGPPVVLVHGVNDQAGTWAAVARTLIAKHRVLIPDLAGHGESEPTTGPIPIALIVEKLALVIDSVAPAASRPSPVVNREPPASGQRDKITLVGNSMGAWIAILYTLQNPERVARLVLESGGGLDRPLAVPLIATNREDALTILRAVHGPDVPLPEWTIDALLARAHGSPMLRLTGLADHFVDARLGDLHVPTTLIWGEHDGVVIRDYVEALHRAIAGSTLEVIEGAAHIPHAQQPERFLACLPAIS